MTDEERQKLVARFRAHEVVMWTDIDLAADEIEKQSNAKPPLGSMFPRTEATETDLHLMAQELASKRTAQSDAKPVRDTPSDHSLELAAQAWCEPETSHKVMDEALCKAFARILDRALAQSDAEPVVQTEFELEDGLHELAFPAPPRPDASAGMIEALEALVIDCENKWGDPHTLAEARATLTTIRARAADRSGKP